MKRILKLILVFICIACIFTMMVSAIDDSNFDHLAGLLLGDYLEKNEGNSISSIPSNAVASYNGVIITYSEVEYQRKLEELSTGITKTDIQIAEEIIHEAMLLQEAERLGLTATAEEVLAFMESMRATYTYPEGKEMIDDYCAGAGISVDEYYAIVEDNALAIITQQKLYDEIGRQYCAENGVEFTKINPPQDMMDAIDSYLNDLFDSHKDEIVYYIDVEA